MDMTDMILMMDMIGRTAKQCKARNQSKLNDEMKKHRRNLSIVSALHYIATTRRCILASLLSRTQCGQDMEVLAESYEADDIAIKRLPISSQKVG